ECSTLLSSFYCSVLIPYHSHSLLLFFFHDTPTTEIYTLSLHDALPILVAAVQVPVTLKIRTGPAPERRNALRIARIAESAGVQRSEEHTSELQSRFDLVCRLLLEKKKKTKTQRSSRTRSPIIYASHDTQ